MVTCKFGPGDQVQISVDGQHLSRITGAELRQILVQCLVFGGGELRADIAEWLAGGKLDELGHYLDQNQQPLKTGIVR
jgi:hypothetical protein